MHSYIFTLSQSVLVTLALTACTFGETTSESSTNRFVAAVAPSQVTAESCEIVLTPLASREQFRDENTIDRNIVRYQRAVLRGNAAIPHLEKLGWSFVSKARQEFDPGYYKLAEQAALCIDTQQADRPESLLLRGYVLHNLHQFREAEELARELVNRRGWWVDQGLLGDVLMEQGRLEEAVEAYQHMMNQRPGPQAYSRAARIRWLKGDVEGAIEMMEWAVRATSVRSPETAAWVQTSLAQYRLQVRDLQQAKAGIERALALQKDYPPALLLRSRMMLSEGEAGSAVQILQQAVRRNPLPEYQWALIETLRAAGQAATADSVAAELEKRGALEDRRTFSLYLATHGRQVPEALRLAQQELQVRADVFTLDAVAWALRASGRIQEAMAFSRRALAEGTREARLAYHAGLIASEAGETEQAAQWLSMAMPLRHMLHPSEREQLLTEFAAIGSQTPTPDPAPSVYRDSTLY